jgi:hypothetical protein
VEGLGSSKVRHSEGQGLEGRSILVEGLGSSKVRHSEGQGLEGRSILL